MALRDEIRIKQNRLADLTVWLDAQPNGEEWYEIIYDQQYSSQAVAGLLTKHGFKADANLIARFRNKHVAK
jgi:hypothetical protein